MDEAETDGPYWCPLCQVPAPSIAACKIHISQSDDATHLGYAGGDLHEEIVDRRTIDEPGVSGGGSLQYSTPGFLVSIKRMITDLLAAIK